MATSLHTTFRNNRGTVSVELALSLMIFLFLAFGIVEYGSMINERNALTQLAREGASIASRQLTANQGVLDLLSSTENALDFQNDPNKYRIFLAQITSGDSVDPNPVCTVVEEGGLANGHVEPPDPGSNCDLPANLFNLLTWQPAPQGTATVEQFTVVKVYYEHDPITPLGNLTWFGGGGGANGSTTMVSTAIF